MTQIDYNEDVILEAGNHPEDSNSALENDLAKIAADPQYDGQSVALYRDPVNDELRAEPEQDVEETDQIIGRLEEDEQEEGATGETNYGLDVIR